MDLILVLMLMLGESIKLEWFSTRLLLSLYQKSDDLETSDEKDHEMRIDPDDDGEMRGRRWKKKQSFCESWKKRHYLERKKARMFFSGSAESLATHIFFAMRCIKSEPGSHSQILNRSRTWIVKWRKRIENSQTTCFNSYSHILQDWRWRWRCDLVGIEFIPPGLPVVRDFGFIRLIIKLHSRVIQQKRSMIAKRGYWSWWGYRDPLMDFCDFWLFSRKDREYINHFFSSSSFF